MKRVFVEKRTDGTLFMDRIGSHEFDKQDTLEILEEAVAVLKQSIALEQQVNKE